MMAELIDRQALLEALYDNEFTTLCPLDEVSGVVCTAPAVDAVEVVRCKDCKHLNAEYCCNNWRGLFDYAKADDYCSYGERREDDGTSPV